jgi:glutamine amidotransferase
MIAIIDLDLGNLYSVKRAFEHLEADIVITDDAEIIKFADKIVLAGVGSYKTGMESIAKKGLYDVISYFAIKKPVLGICLGMQMLMDSSQENGGTKGLGLISGNVRYFNDSSLFVPKFSVPNMGWIDTRCNQKGCFNNSKILTGISEKR